MNRDIVSSSTRTSSLYRLYEWLKHSGYGSVWSRLCEGRPGRTVIASLSHGNHVARDLIHLGSYNYSGLNDHDKIRDAAIIALQKYGPTTSGVRLLNGTTPLHLELEKRLADFIGFDDCVTYSSGYIANVTIIAALANEKDVIFTDELNHASIVDGIRLSRAKQVKYLHRSMNQLEGLLKNIPLSQRKFIITDGIFSMDGDLAPLDQIVVLAKKYNAFTIVDDAHATACCGTLGQGTVNHFGLEGKVDVIIGSLSKGLPGIGGFACTNKKIANLLRYGSHGYFFSASLPPSVVAGLIKAIDILESEPERQVKLHKNEKLLRDGLRDVGLDVMHSETPIIPIAMPSRKMAFEYARKMHDHGVFVNPVCFPAVAINKSRIRVNASASLEESDIVKALSAFKNCAIELGLI